jgi:hypothetical protein
MFDIVDVCVLSYELKFLATKGNVPSDNYKNAHLKNNGKNNLSKRVYGMDLGFLSPWLKF